jgi:hypothetical protein
VSFVLLGIGPLAPHSELRMVYSNDEIFLVMTRSHILGDGGYEVFTVQTFGNVMLVLMYQIDIVVLCQTLKDEERRGILETTHAFQPAIKCGPRLRREQRCDRRRGSYSRICGPSTLLNPVGKLLTQRVSVSS